MQSWGPSINSFEAFNMNFGYFVQYTSPMKRHYWYFLIQPSGSALGSKRCCNMESWGPSNHSFEAFNMKFGYFVQYTSPLKRHYWYCLISPSGLASASRRSYKMESWGCGIHSFVAFNMSVHQHPTMGKTQHCCSNPNMNFRIFCSIC